MVVQTGRHISVGLPSESPNNLLFESRAEFHRKRIDAEMVRISSDIEIVIPAKPDRLQRFALCERRRGNLPGTEPPPRFTVLRRIRECASVMPSVCPGVISRLLHSTPPATVQRAGDASVRQRSGTGPIFPRLRHQPNGRGDGSARRFGISRQRQCCHSKHRGSNIDRDRPIAGEGNDASTPEPLRGLRAGLRYGAYRP